MGSPLTRPFYCRFTPFAALLFLGALCLPACNRDKGIPDGVNAQVAGSNFKVGDDIEVRFTIGGLSSGAGGALSGFDVDILFDSAVLALKSSSFEDPATALNPLVVAEEDALPFDGAATANGGVVDAFAVSGNTGAALDGAQANAFAFLVLTFSAVAPSAETSVSLDVADPALLFADSNNSAMPQTFPSPGVKFSVTAP